MMAEYDFAAAMMVGLLGAGHCLGMCGGIVGALTGAISPTQPLPLNLRMIFTTYYNLGRICSYVMAGSLVGGLSAALTTLGQANHVLALLQALAAFMLILMGLQIGGLFQGLRKIEALGYPLWQRLTPLRQRLPQIKHPYQAWLAGMVWGWLPCGLVYSTLTWALAAADPFAGGRIMLGFGLGTLPALITMGAASQWLSIFLQQRGLRVASGLLLMGYGVHMMWIASRWFVL